MKRLYLKFILLYSTITYSQTPNGITVAGGNGIGSNANQLSYPSGIVVDSIGNIYVSDQNNHRVQKWAPGASNGVTVAGNGVAGNGQNQLNKPAGIFLDKQGNLYIADFENYRIQKWAIGSNSGSTVGNLSYPTDVFVDLFGNIYAAQSGFNTIVKFYPGDLNGIDVAGTFGSYQGRGLHQIDYPSGLFIDKFGSIYISELYNHRVTKWEEGASSGLIVAGDGVLALPNNTNLAYPWDVFLDNNNNIYVCDGNNRIQRWLNGATSAITVAGGNGYGINSNQLDGPKSIFVDNFGNIYVSDYYNHRIQKFTPLVETPKVYSLETNTQIIQGTPLKVNFKAISN